jgi:hypothetical protein
MKKYFFLITLIGLVAGGCNKFDDINTNPDATENVNAAMLATNIILKNLKFQGRDAKAYLSDNALAKYIAYGNESMMATQYNYLGSSDFSPMTILPNIESMLKYASGSVMENSYKGLAKFMKAYMFYNLTMQVGDIPYSAAGNGKSGEIEVKYDKQEDVFKGILDDLKAADQFFAKGTTFDGDPTPFNGDPAKWRRATNAFALQVLMSLSKKADVASLNVKGRFADIVAADFLLQPTSFLGLNYSTTNPHPLSGTNDLFTSRTIVSSLVIDKLKAYNDRRMYYYADPAKAKLAGGLQQGDSAAYVGADVSDDYNDITQALNANQYSLLNSRYLKEQASEPRMLLTYAEQQLILAEARILGWITTGTAKDFYESGVKSALANLMATKASYAHGMPITQSYIDSYFTGEAAFKSTPDEQLQQIWMQKYLLNFMQNSLTAYFEFRRTGYPVFPVNPATSLNENNKNAVPVRWLYPSSETNYNRTNLIEALDRQYGGVDDSNNLMWILK